MSMTPEHTFHDDPEGYICALQNRIDSLTAEIATLKAEVERLQTIALCGDKSHLLVIRERDALRTHLKALVEAGEEIESAMTMINIVPCYKTVDDEKYVEMVYHKLDALASAVAKAKDILK